jgi:hypothetical protein
MNEESSEFLKKFERFVNIQNRHNEILETNLSFSLIDHNQSIIKLAANILRLGGHIILSSVIIGLAIVFHKLF